MRTWFSAQLRGVLTELLRGPGEREREREIDIYIYMGVSKIRGIILGVPIIRTGSILGSPYLGKLPYIHAQCSHMWPLGLAEDVLKQAFQKKLFHILLKLAQVHPVACPLSRPQDCKDLRSRGQAACRKLYFGFDARL